MTTFAPFLDRLIDLALEEDLAGGDVTTLATVDPGTRATAEVVAKEPMVVSGLVPFVRVFARIDPTIEIEPLVNEGAEVESGDVVVRLSGDARSLLVGERPALNFLMRLSGVATLTHAMANALREHPHTRLVDTRKTTPGWRQLEKAAVRAGGGANHRAGLFDGVLIKDNHIAAAGGIQQAVARAQKAAHHLLKIEVETTTLDEVQQALEAGADVLLFDNMDNALLAKAVAKVRDHEKTTGRKVVLEASGNMTIDRLPKVAALGIDLVSVGALTHGARSVDLSMRLKLS